MVWKWINQAKGPVPSPDWVIPIEKALESLVPPEDRVNRFDLRADLYPREQVAA